MTDESLLGATQDQAPADEPAAKPAEAVAGETPKEPDTPAAESEKYDFVLDKYRADGKTEQEAALEQAKGYSEIRKQLGSFNGAPDEYEIAVAEEIQAAGYELDKENPLFAGVASLAKEMNMSQEGLNKLVNLYAENQLSEFKALDEVKASELKALGSNAQSRIDGVNKYISANFDADTVSAIQMMATTSESIKAIEAMISKGKAAPVAAEAPAAPAATLSELREMQFAKDDYGNRKISSDAEFRRLYLEKQKAVYGDAEHNVTIG